MEQPSYKEKAYRFIKKEILTGSLSPDDILSEQVFAQRLNVSRTPVHEAITQLSAEGFVRIMPSRGVVVSSISVNDIHMVYQARMLVEPGIARLAAHNPDTQELEWYQKEFSSTKEISLTKDGRDLDSEFHIAIARKTGNTYLLRLEENLLSQCQRIRILSTHEAQARDALACDEHQAIINALLDKDEDQAARAALHHLERSLHDYAQIFSSCGKFTV